RNEKNERTRVTEKIEKRTELRCAFRTVTRAGVIKTVGRSNSSRQKRQKDKEGQPHSKTLRATRGTSLPTGFGLSLCRFLLPRIECPTHLSATLYTSLAIADIDSKNRNCNGVCAAAV